MSTQSSETETDKPAQQGYRLLDDPYVRCDPKLDVVMITSCTAFLHGKDGKPVTDGEGRYSVRFPKQNLILNALNLTLASLTPSEWEDFKANQSIQLSKVSKAISDTYNEDTDRLWRPYRPTARMSRLSLVLEQEAQPRSTRNESVVWQTKSKGVLSAAPTPYNDDPTSQADGPLVVTISGIVTSQHTRKLTALSARSVKIYGAIVVGMLPLVTADLEELEKCKTFGRNHYLRATRRLKPKLRSLAEAAYQQWSESWVGPDHLDHDRWRVRSRALGRHSVPQG